jgi:hypothetical protein
MPLSSISFFSKVTVKGAKYPEPKAIILEVSGIEEEMTAGLKHLMQKDG